MPLEIGSQPGRQDGAQARVHLSAITCITNLGLVANADLIGNVGNDTSYPTVLDNVTHVLLLALESSSTLIGKQPGLNEPERIAYGSSDIIKNGFLASAMSFCTTDS